MSELLPCPFCGGEAEVIRNNIGVFVGCFHGYCPIGPSTSTYVDGYSTEAEAIKAWNTRAERTCENITEKKRANQFECSKCHCIVEDAENYYVNVYERGKFFNGNTYDWNYCPNCGAKVIDTRGDNR